MPTFTPVAVGFAEFVATLLSETLDAVIASTMGQEERRFAMLEAVNTDVKEFAALYVSDEEVAELEAERFGDAEGRSTIVERAQPPSAERLEVLGIDLGRASGTRRGLTGAEVEQIRNGLRELIARRRLAALRDAVEQGLPRVVVDQGHIVAKVMFDVLNVEEDEAESSAPRKPRRPPATGLAPGLVNPLLSHVTHLESRPSPGPSTPAPTAAAGLSPHLAAATRNLRLRVRPIAPGMAPAEAGAEENAGDGASTSVMGEIQVTFRTVF